MTKKVVVTGLAAITPIGNDLASSWESLVAGASGMGPITQFDCSDFATKFAAEVKGFDASKFMDAKKAKRMERFCHFAVAASTMLLKDADFTISEEEAYRVGVVIGCGIGGIEILEHNHTKMLEGGPRRISPFMVPLMITNMAPGMVSMAHGAKGPNFTGTSACASAIHSIGTAMSEIQLGRADAMITGGVESTITTVSVGGFNALKALSTRNDDPQRASRPFDRDRDGFVMGEGCGLLLIESEEHAKARGAKIYAELSGYGASADAFHMTAPDEEGLGMAASMNAAISSAGLTPDEVEHVNAHATSTPMNDLCETRGMKKVFGKRAYDIPITANKSMIGHLLGAAGGVESVFSVMTLAKGVIPGTINLENPDPECDLDYVADGSRTMQVNNVLCNSFGFGGTNGSLLFTRPQA